MRLRVASSLENFTSASFDTELQRLMHNGLLDRPYRYFIGNTMLLLRACALSRAGMLLLSGRGCPCMRALTCQKAARLDTCEGISTLSADTQGPLSGLSGQ